MLKSRFPAIIAGLTPGVQAGVEAGVRIVASEAKGRAPDAPPLGEGLVAAIHVEHEPEGSYVVAGDKDVFYGHMVENGTVHSPPQPFLIPALEASRKDIVVAVEAAIKVIT